MVLFFYFNCYIPIFPGERARQGPVPDQISMAGARTLIEVRSESTLGPRPPINNHQPRSRSRLQSPKQVHEQFQMAPQAISMTSGLIAIALVIKCGTGPRFVFHYPPNPTDQVSQRETRWGTELDVSDAEDQDGDLGDSDESDLEDGGFQLNQSVGKLGLGESATKKKRHTPTPEEDDHYTSSTGEQVVPWEHIGEFSTTDLEMILTPSKAFHKKKFELSLDPLYFVSYPMHIRGDGFWKKKRPKKVKKSKLEAFELEPGDANSAETPRKEGSERTSR
jgi:hypothetical protein